MDSVRVCVRCGRILHEWHLINGLPVCTDDRLCYPGKQVPRRLKKLMELKSKYEYK